MTVEVIKQQIATLTPPEYQEVWSFVVSEEYERRNADRYTAKLVGEMQDNGELSKPEAATEEEVKAGADAVPEWKNPGTRHDLMYHYGDVVRYNVQLVRSTHQGLNHWTPGVLNYDGRIWGILETPDEPETSETTEQPAAPAFKQPTGSHDAYKQGDKVTFNGEVYESLIDANAYSPEAYPQGWKKL